MTDDSALETVEQFHEKFGGELSVGDETVDVDMDWHYWVETPTGQFMLIRFAEEFENHAGETVEMEPALVLRYVNYHDEDPVPVGLMLVIEDDPNGFQREVVTGPSMDDTELTLSVEPTSEYEHGDRDVTLRYSEDREVFTVLEDITEMG